jgi:hypothetical protein
LTLQIHPDALCIVIYAAISKENLYLFLLLTY